MDCGFTDFKSIIDNCIGSKVFWSPNKCLTIITKMLKTVNNMHKLNIFHIDIKPDNLIFNDKKGEL